MARAKKLKIVIPKDEQADDLKEFMKNFYEDNPFYPTWPWGKISNRHAFNIDRDNMWYRHLRDHKKVLELEEAPF